MKLSDELLNKMFQESLPKDIHAVLYCLESAVKRHGDTGWVDYYIEGTPYMLCLSLRRKTADEIEEEQGNG